MNASAADQIDIAVIAFDDATGELFLREVGVEPGPSADYESEGQRIRLATVTVTDGEDFDAVFGASDAAVILVRFLDRITLERVKDVMLKIHRDRFRPRTVVILREDGEEHFKMSCSYCGQKLWVRDADVGRRGNCPQCKKVFLIPEQQTYVTSHLMLTDSEPLRRVSVGDKSAGSVIDSLAQRVKTEKESMKSSTMRIELPPDDPAGI